MRIGYGRVSTRDQRPEAQHGALTAAGCQQIFLDKASGKLASRPELSKALLVANRPEDQLVVTKLDRLGRSLEHLIELSKTLQDRGVDLVVLDQGIDTRARGRTGGQKPKLGPRQVELARQMYDELDEHGKRRYTVGQIAAEFGVTRPTIYRHSTSQPRSLAAPQLTRRYENFIGFSATTTGTPEHARLETSAGRRGGGPPRSSRTSCRDSQGPTAVESVPFGPVAASCDGVMIDICSVVRSCTHNQETG
ncbi:recombinase family protein [Nocardia sp. NPDC051990]|uniref:recombinase family protein n=1 Tax=Nocardia sp. NPDC051990 TaxID=3155285 RepID=UPI00343F683C